MKITILSIKYQSYIINLQMVISPSKLHASAYIIREHFRKGSLDKTQTFQGECFTAVPYDLLYH